MPQPTFQNLDHLLAHLHQCCKLLNNETLTRTHQDEYHQLEGLLRELNRVLTDLEALTNRTISDLIAVRTQVDQLRPAFVGLWANRIDPPLTPRELQVLEYVLCGNSNKEIANLLGISHKTVKNHISSILHKLGTKDRNQAAIYALRQGWIKERSNTSKIREAVLRAA